MDSPTHLVRFIPSRWIEPRLYPISTWLASSAPRYPVHGAAWRSASLWLWNDGSMSTPKIEGVPLQTDRKLRNCPQIPGLEGLWKVSGGENRTRKNDILLTFAWEYVTKRHAYAINKHEDLGKSHSRDVENNHAHISTIIDDTRTTLWILTAKNE